MWLFLFSGADLSPPLIDHEPEVNELTNFPVIQVDLEEDLEKFRVNTD